MNAQSILRAIVGLFVGLAGLVLILPVLALLVPIWAVDRLTVLLRGVFGPSTVPWEDLIEFAPEVGWKPRAGVAAHALDFNEDAYYVTTDDAGWRGKGTVADSDVVVFGDSYAFGCGVDDDDFFADLPTDVRIKAIGCPAYSMVHSVIWMERMASSLRDKLVVWLIYPGNDLADNTDPAFLDYRAPFVRSLNGTGEWKIFSDHVGPTKWTLDSREGGMDSYVKICSPTLQSERAFAACDGLIRRGRAICDGAGAHLVVMSIPDLSLVAGLALEKALAESGDGADFDAGLPDRMLNETCQREGIRFVALKDYLGPEDYLERDFHWSPRGHARLAELISELFRGVA